MILVEPWIAVNSGCVTVYDQKINECVKPNEASAPARETVVYSDDHANLGAAYSTAT